MVKKSLCWIVIFCFPFYLFSDSIEKDKEKENIVVKQHSYGAFEFGQIGHGHYKQGSNLMNSTISHVWQERAFANIGLTALYKDFVELNFVGEGFVGFSTPQIGKHPTTLQPRHFFYIKSSNAKINLGNPSFLSTIIQLGYFPYKYNSEVRNLGEYLLRSTPYPLIVYADFDYPMATLLGGCINLSGFNRMFSNDLLIHSELITIPVQNWSISDIAELNLFNIITLGGGVSLYHWLNVYQGKYMSRTAEKYYYPENLDSTLANTFGDTTLDNHRAIKVMARATIDPKEIIKKILRRDSPLPFFNRNDLKIYGEVNILGVKNYPVYYESMKDRTIYTFGFNFPAGFIMDLINIELEYCSNKSAFSDAGFTGSDHPRWEPMSLGYDETGQKVLERDPWRWSLYLKKSIFDEHLGFIFQIARDHKKINFYYFDIESMSFAETLPCKEDWWWVFKTEFKF